MSEREGLPASCICGASCIPEHPPEASRWDSYFLAPKSSQKPQYEGDILHVCSSGFGGAALHPASGSAESVAANVMVGDLGGV